VPLLALAFGGVWEFFCRFGPLLFRLNYPDLAPLSKTFRLVALPCILAYFVLRPGAMSGSQFDKFLKHKKCHQGRRTITVWKKPLKRPQCQVSLTVGLLIISNSSGLTLGPLRYD